MPTPNPDETQSLYAAYQSANTKANKANAASRTARKKLLAHFGRFRHLPLPNGATLSRTEVSRAAYESPATTYDRFELSANES